MEAEALPSVTKAKAKSTGALARLNPKKAEPEKAYLKIGFYGESGTGKSFTSLLLAEELAKRDPLKRRILYIDTELGTDFAAQRIPDRKVHPEAFDYDRQNTREVLLLRDVLADPATAENYCVVILDSMTHLWESAKEAWTGGTTSAKTLPIQAWAVIKPPYKDMLTNGLNGEFHFIICGRERIIFEEESGKIQVQGTAMKAESETQYEPDILVNLYQERREKSARGLSEYILKGYVEKDRSGVLQGRTLTWPKASDFTPILQYLGDKHGQLQTIDEAATGDAESRRLDDERKEALRNETFNIIKTAMEDAAKTGKHEALRMAFGQTTGKKKILGDEKFDELVKLKDNLKNEINNRVAV